MKAKSGAYVLALRSRMVAEIEVGRWGVLTIEPGYYFYVGSAFGKGGVQARVLRHCRKTKPKHWHLDYLREFVEPIGAWYRYDSKHFEHEWAQSITDVVGYTAIKGFGASDCNCYSHLFFVKNKSSIALLPDAVGAGIESWLFCNETNKHT